MCIKAETDESNIASQKVIYFLSFFILWLMFFFTGISRGGDHNFVTTMISLLPENNKIVAINIMYAFYALGAVVTPVILLLKSREVKR